jgi:hypothetical protein
MQPYFFPYIGYYQLMNEVDTFVLTDSYEFSKGGWINRNRISSQNQIRYLTLPLQASSDYSPIGEKRISSDFVPHNSLNLVIEAYRKRPYFSEVVPLIDSVLCYPERNLFYFLLNSIENVIQSLGIETNLILTSQFDLNPNLSGQGKIIEICREIGASQYVNLPGGKSIYRKETFHELGVDLKFLNVNDFRYDQGTEGFTPNLSILDVLFNLGIGATSQDILNRYSIE